MSNKNLNAVKRIGAKLAYIRKSKKISQIRLAEMTDMNFNYIGQIEQIVQQGIEKGEIKKGNQRVV